MYLTDEAAAVVAAANLSKSERIRRLKDQGMRQADIARALGISDQFVANVVGRMKSRSASAVDEETEPVSRPIRARAQLGEGGRLVVPAAIRSALGAQIGDTLLLRVEDGELRVVTVETALRRAQDIVRQFVPEGRWLSEELIAERRAAAARE